MLILHQIVCQKLRLILLRASQMTNDYGERPWAPAEIFVGGGGGKSEKGPHMMKKAPPHKRSRIKRPPHGGGGSNCYFFIMWVPLCYFFLQVGVGFLFLWGVVPVFFWAPPSPTKNFKHRPPSFYKS